jgi:hypothetical protein
MWLLFHRLVYPSSIIWLQLKLLGHVYKCTVVAVTDQLAWNVQYPLELSAVLESKSLRTVRIMRQCPLWSMCTTHTSLPLDSIRIALDLTWINIWSFITRVVAYCWKQAGHMVNQNIKMWPSKKCHFLKDVTNLTTNFYNCLCYVLHLILFLTDGTIPNIFEIVNPSPFQLEWHQILVGCSDGIT